jgi:hypothetical protein
MFGISAYSETPFSSLAGAETINDVKESASLTDLVAADFINLGSIVESATGADQFSTSVVFVTEVLEIANASEVVETLNNIFNAPVVENSTASDQLVSIAELNSVVSEASESADTVSSTAIFNSSIVENATIADKNYALFVLDLSVTEGSTASDSVVAAPVYATVVLEAGAGSDVISALPVYLVIIKESGDAADKFTVAPSTFNANVLEGLDASEIIVVSGTFNASVAEGVEINDEIIRRLLWELIDNFEDTTWQLLPGVDSQWDNVDASDPVNWNVVPTQNN